MLFLMLFSFHSSFLRVDLSLLSRNVAFSLSFTRVTFLEFCEWNLDGIEGGVLGPFFVADSFDVLRFPISMMKVNQDATEISLYHFPCSKVFEERGMDWFKHFHD